MTRRSLGAYKDTSPDAVWNPTPISTATTEPSLLSSMQYQVISRITAIILAVLTSVNASGVPLTQAQAEARFIPNGITASSSGNCTNNNIQTCTSYSGILSGTVDGVITLKKASGVTSLVITGGTEVGHPGGIYSHANGYKVDVRYQPKLDTYIKTAFTRIPNRGDGYPQWQAPSGNIYCDEASHWDITYF